MTVKEFSENELLFNKLYEKTKDCGRTQFINLLMQAERENKDLKRQLKLLRNGEYFNQLKFERDLLRYLVDHGEVSKEDKKFIDMTHRNTQLLEENRKYKEVIDKAIKYIEQHAITVTDGAVTTNKHELLEILKEVE